MANDDKDPGSRTSTMLNIDFDLAALREKYRREREKRLRPEGIDQYLHIGDEYAWFEDDPYTAPLEREPLTDEVEVALIGGGFGGLVTGARLRQLGVKDIRIIEKGGDIGGTWYWNRYPGLACDTESYVYMPLLEEIGYIPTEKYASGAEIFKHCRAIAQKYDLYDNACLQTEVTAMHWDENTARWVIRTDRGDAMKAKFVVLANGFLQKPKLPGIPGVTSFRGKVFHTSRWDYDYTGDDANGNLTKLHDKRVGIIGTGATAVQCVPHLGASAGHLYVFQRTPSSIDERNNRPTDPLWAAGLEPGWQQRRIDNFQILTAGGYAEEDLVDDGWTDITKNLAAIFGAEEDPDLSPEAIAEKAELADHMKMEQIRRRVESIVDDPETAEALKPYYRQFCKRPCFHDEYLQTFNRPNVTLVDTDGKGVERITENGVVANGVEYELDCLIYATGFEVGTDFASRAGYDPVGRGGQSLTQRWANGARTLHGIHMHGFPNCYMMNIAQAGFTVNFAYLLTLQATHIAYVIERGLALGVRSMEVTEAAEAEWSQKVYDMGERTVEFSRNCTPGYYNNEGQPDEKSRRSGFFFGEPLEYAEILENWRANGDLAGLEIIMEKNKEMGIE